MTPATAQLESDLKTCQARWQADPIAFFTEALDVNPDYVWDKMVEVAESVRDNVFTVVGAGHGVSKTYTAGRIAPWFLYCFPPATVITTAPTFSQVKDLLWREIKLAHANSRIPLGGKVTQVMLDLQEETGLKWFAKGFSCRPDTVTDEATAFQGYHNDHILIIFDEAAGVMPQIWKAAQHLATSGHVRVLMIGNPTASSGDFAEALKGKGGYNVINISVLDTPNYKEGSEVIPGVSGRDYEKRIREKYGKDSNEYKIRVLGQLPEYTQGTFFGREMAKARRENRVGFFPPDPHAQVYTVWDIGHTNTAIWFVQFIRQEIRLIDFYYDDKGVGLAAYAKMLQDKPYRYCQHFAPHDVEGSNAKSVQTGRYLVDVARDLGIGFTVLSDYGFDDGIAAAKDLVSLCRFNETLCGEGITALELYRQQLDATRSTDDKPVYLKHPVADYTCHIADAFRYLAMCYRYDLIIDDQRVGFPGAYPNETQLAAGDDDDFDPLGGVVRRR